MLYVCGFNKYDLPVKPYNDSIVYACHVAVLLLVHQIIVNVKHIYVMVFTFAQSDLGIWLICISLNFDCKSVYV